MFLAFFEKKKFQNKSYLEFYMNRISFDKYDDVYVILTMPCHRLNIVKSRMKCQEKLLIYLFKK